MKLAFLTPEYPHPKTSHSGGIGTSTKNLVDALVSKGTLVTVFVYNQTENTVIKNAGVTIHLIAKKQYTMFGWYLYRKHLQNYINTTIKTENIQLLEAPDWTGITAFMTFKVPVIIRFHGTDAYFCNLEGRPQKFKNFVFEKLALKKATAYIAPSNFTKHETAKLFSLKPEAIRVIPNGIKLEHFNNDKPNVYNDYTLLYVGTLIRKKGVLELAKIFNALVENIPNAKLIVIGNDAFDVKTQSASTYNLMQNILSEKANANTKYLGKLPYFKISNHIKKAHVCVFPSFAETFGMVTLESMAMQKPVVNSSIGWAQELIDDGEHGYLIHPTETQAYVNSIIKLFNDKSLCAKIGAAARQKAERYFNSDDIAVKTIAFYQSIISETPS